MNKIKQLFMDKFYDLLLNNVSDLEYEFTKILVDITDSDYGYFNHVISKDDKVYNKGSGKIIDKKGFFTEKQKKSFNGALFPLDIENKDKPWANNYFCKKLKCTDMSKYEKRLCPLTSFKFYCNIPLIYNEEVVGCIAIAGDNDYKDKLQIIDKISKIVSDQLWKHKYSYDKIIKKKNYLYDFFMCAYKDNDHLKDIYKVKYNLVLKIMKIFKCQYGFISEMAKYKGKDAFFSKTVLDNSKDQKMYKEFSKKNPNGVYFELNLGPEHPPHVPYYTKKKYINNNMSDYYKNHERLCPIKFKNFFAAPLIYNNKHVGTLALGNIETSFDKEFENDISVYLDIFANIIWSKLTIDSENKFYLSQISHELKTPLNAIVGFTQLIKMNHKNIDKYLDYILENSSDLLKLINDSLNYNKLDFFVPSKTNVNLSNIISSILISCINREDITVLNEVKPGIYINFDNNLIKSLIKNLLTNVNKYCSDNGVCKIWIEKTKKKYYLNVENTGEFAVKNKSVFVPFNKGAHTKGGHGLGLSIMKKICDLCGEKISFHENTENKKVMFRISFDKCESHNIPKILYIEDNFFNQQLVKELLSGHVIIDCIDNAHDMNVLHNYQFLLLDWHLNAINGIDVFKYIQDNKLDVKILVLTADTNPTTTQFFNKNKIPYLHKPIDIKQLNIYISDIFGIHI